MTGKRQIVDGEVYIWTRRGWRLVRDGLIRTRRGWRKMRQPSRGIHSSRNPSPPSVIQQIADPIQPVAAPPHRRQWHGKYAALQARHESEGR